MIEKLTILENIDLIQIKARSKICCVRNHLQCSYLLYRLSTIIFQRRRLSRLLPLSSTTQIRLETDHDKFTAQIEISSHLSLSSTLWVTNRNIRIHRDSQGGTKLDFWKDRRI